MIDSWKVVKIDEQYSILVPKRGYPVKQEIYNEILTLCSHFLILCKKIKENKSQIVSKLEINVVVSLTAI